MSNPQRPALTTGNAATPTASIALACALAVTVLALLAVTGSLYAGGWGEGDTEVAPWIEPLVSRNDDVLQDAIDADRALRSYLTLDQREGARYESERDAAIQGLASLRGTAKAADSETAGAVEAFARDVESWRDFGDDLFRKAGKEGREAGKLALITGVGGDRINKVKDAHAALEGRLNLLRKNGRQAGNLLDGAQSSVFPVALALGLLAAGLGGWLAFRAVRRRIPETPAIDLARLRAVLDGVPEGIAIAGNDGRLLVANKAAGRVLDGGDGAPRGIALFWGQGEPVREDEAPLAIALRGEPVHDRAFFVEGVDGSMVPVTVSAEPVLDESGLLVAAVATIRDQTEPMQLAAQLSAAAERAQFAEKAFADARRRIEELGADLLEAEAEAARIRRDLAGHAGQISGLIGSATAVGLALFDASDFHLIEVNEHGLVMLGERRKASDAHGASLAELIPKAEESGLAEIFRTVAATGETFGSDEFRCEGMRQGVAYWRFSLAPFSPGADGRPTALLLAGVDVTPAVQARESSAQALDRERRILQTTIDRLPDAVLVADAKGVVRFANRAAQGLGIPASGIALGADVAEYAAAWRCTGIGGGPQFPPSAFPLARALRGEIVADLEVAAHGPGSGAGRPLRVSASPFLNETRTIIGAVMHAREIAVEETREVAAAGAPAHKVEDLLLAISNDLRTPVLSIQGMLELFRQRYADAIPDVTALHYLELTQRNAEQMVALVEDLAELSSLGRSAMAVTDVPLTAVVEEAWQASPRGGMELRVAGPLPVIRADRAKLVRALRDVFDMSALFRTDGPTAWVHVRTRDLDSALEIDVKDNGRGFKPEETEILFGPLASVSGDQPQDGSAYLGGVGIGLAAARRVAEMHGGAATVTGTPGQGATYTITIAKK